MSSEYRTIDCRPEFYRELMDLLNPEERWNKELEDGTNGLLLFSQDFASGDVYGLIFRRAKQ